MNSRTSYAILGMLQSGPRSGYDLKKDFEERVRHFWSESPGQIYPALHRMHEDGWVRAREQQHGARARTVYSITPRGRSEFERWMAEEPARPTVRNELLLKLYFGGTRTADALLEHVGRMAKEQEQLLVHYESVEDEIQRVARDPVEVVLWKLTLSSGRHMAQARKEWCREATRTLRRVAKDLARGAT